jgi:tRNA-dihydrouridine synthase A
MSSHFFAIAPMLDWTDRHCRYLFRLISRHSMLYTEMISTGAILYGKNRAFLAYDPSEHPLALQLGGCDPQALATCAKIAEDDGYDEVNLNVGCPSARVQSARFGACLMAEPEVVAQCIMAMQAAVKIPITVKSRIGIDGHDSYEGLVKFIETVAAAGCNTFIIHARKAWLQGLNPKQNRTVPPLRYDVVYQLKRDFPQLKIIINGGVTDILQVQDHLQLVDGVMVGRAFYQNPYSFIKTDQIIYNSVQPAISRHAIMQQFLPYVERQLAAGVPLAKMTRHVLNLFHGQPGACAFRRYLSEHAPRRDAGIEVLKEAMQLIN